MKRLLPVFAASLALSTPAIAQVPGPGPGGPPMLRHFGGPGAGFGLLQFDANADGKLTRAEFDAAQKTRFNEIDANKDGTATPEEAQAARQARFHAMEKERFAALDTDKNGQLSATEFQAARESGRGFGPPGGLSMRIRGPGRGPDFGAPGGPDAPGGPPDQTRRERPRPGDANNDGNIGFAEFTARPTEAFTQADANKDGTVTISELQAQARGPR